MRRLFTKRFFRLSANDQAAIVDAALHDIDTNQYCSDKDRKRTKRLQQRIIGKAVKYGIFAGNGGKK